MSRSHQAELAEDFFNWVKSLRKESAKDKEATTDEYLTLLQIYIKEKGLSAEEEGVLFKAISQTAKFDYKDDENEADENEAE